MRHWHAGVVFAICEARDRGDCHLRNQFANEDNSAAISATNIEAKVHFFEGLMERHRAAEQARFVELESDEAYVGVALVVIEFSARWDEGPKKSWIDGIVQHEQVLPLGGEEGALLGWRCHTILIAETAETLRESRRGSGGPHEPIEIGRADPA